MNKFVELTTKKARREFIQAKVATDPRWMIKGLLTIYQHQTEDEQRQDVTKVHNGVGFGAFDAEIMSSIAKRLIQKGAKSAIEHNQPIILQQYLSPKEEVIVRHKMKKYAGQLARIADQKAPLVKKQKVAA